ncbi:hypothetical protein ABXS75_00625 [Roseburia hominis]
MNTIHAPQMSVSLEFEFMGADLTAEYMVSDEGMTILFSSDAVESAESITLSAMTADFNELVEEQQLDERQVLQAIKNDVYISGNDASSGIIDFSKIKFRLKGLELKIFIGKDGKKSVSYAITLEILLDGILPDIKIIHIKSLNFCLKNMK